MGRRGGTHGWGQVKGGHLGPPLEPYELSGVFFLIDGRHIAQGLDDARHDLEHMVDVGRGGFPAEGEDQGALGQSLAFLNQLIFGTKAYSAKNGEMKRKRFQATTEVEKAVKT